MTSENNNTEIKEVGFGLDWEKVKVLIEKHLGDLDIEIEVYV